MHIGFTIATLALTFLCAVHEGVTAEPKTLQEGEGASGQPRNHYPKNGSWIGKIRATC